MTLQADGRKYCVGKRFSFCSSAHVLLAEFISTRLQGTVLCLLFGRNMKGTAPILRLAEIMLYVLEDRCYIGKEDSTMIACKVGYEICVSGYCAKGSPYLFAQSYDSANIGLLLKEDTETHIKQCTSSLRRNTRTRKVYDCQASGLEILVPTRPEGHEELTLMAQSLPATAFDFLAFGPVDISVCDFGMKLSNISKR
jgi:hypothetical protein